MGSKIELRLGQRRRDAYQELHHETPWLTKQVLCDNLRKGVNPLPNEIRVFNSMVYTYSTVDIFEFKVNYLEVRNLLMDKNLRDRLKYGNYNNIDNKEVNRYSETGIEKAIKYKMK